MWGRMWRAVHIFRRPKGIASKKTFGKHWYRAINFYLMDHNTTRKHVSSHCKLRCPRTVPDTFPCLLCPETINQLKTRKLLDEMVFGTRRHIVCQKFTNIVAKPNIVGAALGVNGLLEPVAKLLSGYTMPHPVRQDSVKFHATSSNSPTVITWKTNENTSGIRTKWPKTSGALE